MQDGEDNNIDLDITSMDNFIISFSQMGTDHSIDLDVDGRTSDGSSIYINQTGSNRSYSASLYCAHSFCTLTVTQPYMKYFTLDNSVHNVVCIDIYWFTRSFNKQILRLKSFDYLHNK